jgi:tetratricopeptide (TPR) repeat protein
MRTLALTIVLLFVAAFSLATLIEPRHGAIERTDRGAASVLSAALGDGKRLFANDVFAKADAYFHRGNYPSIFELGARRTENHMAEAASGDSHAGETPEEHAAHAEHPEEEHHDEGPPARDWIEAFGRHFYPAAHAHLGKGQEREMLPWLKLAASLDPHQVESYMVAAYWLRERLGKVDEAEQFLRDGLRQNPGNPELLNELARLNLANRNDPARARNLWLAALSRWQPKEGAEKDPNEYLLEQILGGLVRSELQQGNTNSALDYLNRLKQVSPAPEAIQQQIDELSARSIE